MEGIPPARASDNEDVIWALETAESLWKRDARVDAIVWVRRAASGAADSGDEERAAALLQEAVVLTELITRASSQLRAAAQASVNPPAIDGDIDSLLGDDEEVRFGSDPAPKPASTLSDDGGAELLDDDSSLELLELDSSDLLSLAPATPVPTGDPSTTELAQIDALVESEDLAAVSVDVSSQAPTPALLSEPEPEAALDRFTTAGITRLGEGALSAMDLAAVPTLAGLSELTLDTLVRAATVILCTADAEVLDFALALVLDGALTATTPGGVVAARFGAGTVLRTRGTFGAQASAQFVATVEDTTLALWSEADLRLALEAAPEVDERLRSECDRMEGWTSVAESPLAARLHEEVRLRLVTRLSPVALQAGQELVEAGRPVPGILLVGKGTVVIDEPLLEVVGPGGFVFAGATLSASKAGATARAGDDGAIVLCADRRTTQELYATEPLLLEILAEG